MPEEHPLQAVEPLELILETELVVFVAELEEVQHLSRSLDHGDRRILGIINQRRNTAIGVESEEPLLLLLVRGDIDDSRSPLCPIFGT